jgi:hypothetical protein
LGCQDVGGQLHAAKGIRTTDPPGTILIDFDALYLYYVQSEGKAIRNGVAVGEEGWPGLASRRLVGWRNELIGSRPPKFRRASALTLLVFQ